MATLRGIYSSTEDTAPAYLDVESTREEVERLHTLLPVRDRQTGTETRHVRTASGWTASNWHFLTPATRERLRVITGAVEDIQCADARLLAWMRQGDAQHDG